MPRGDQLSRQLRLIHLLSTSTRTLAQLAGEQACSKRTVQRDITVLERAGLPVLPETRNGTTFWRFVEGFRPAVPLPFTVPELMALVFSKGVSAPPSGRGLPAPGQPPKRARAAGAPLSEYLASAIAKVRSQLGPALLRYVDQMEQGLAVTGFGAKDYSSFSAVIQAVNDAISKRTTVEVDYFSFHSRSTQARRFDPYRLWYSNQSLYVVGFDHLRKALRTFAIDRVRGIRLTGQRFELPADFDFDSLAKHAFPVMLREEAVPVRIYFTPEQAPYIAERQWHSTQKLEHQADGSVVLSLEVGDTGEVLRWLVGFGSEAMVLEPAELRDTIRREAERIAAMLGHPTPARTNVPRGGSRRGKTAALARSRAIAKPAAAGVKR